MTTPQGQAEKAGLARYTYRFRVSSTARAALEAEWARCRWIWNECVARSKKAYIDGEKCGPARLDKLLTQARAANTWLRGGSSVPQQQLIRDFAASRAKALARKAADAAIGATKQALIHMAAKCGRQLHLVHPAYTTMDCAHCGARTKHALPLSERTYACTACGTVSPRDKNSARVMLVRAGFNPAGTDRGSLDRSLSARAA